jgi:hypothetical protein
MSIELENRHRDEINETETFEQQQKNKHNREFSELNALTKKQQLKIESEEMYGRIMEQKRIWKNSDIEMDAWSKKKQSKND